MRIIKIPRERVGVIIGTGGKTREELQNISGIPIHIDSEGEVTIYESEKSDPLMTLKLFDVIKAIGRGFSPERAMRLFQDDEYLETIDLKEFVGSRRNQLARVRARLIGSEGKTRGLIEDLTGTYMSVYGNTVSLIGDSVTLPVAKHAVEMILRGSEHSTVYRYLERQRPRLRIAEMGFDI
ncbi:MAG: ribosomal assembly protein [Candidatus Methanomethylophilaceae archaeon]|nr:ribosomal assembly protein [Candidatus Methanomethylophilaceae archaeon]MDI3541519.1 ribosomal assembly protein [Candidatus Methanomethylophilaceae archaeon]